MLIPLNIDIAILPRMFSEKSPYLLFLENMKRTVILGFLKQSYLKVYLPLQSFLHAKKQFSLFFKDFFALWQAKLLLQAAKERRPAGQRLLKCLNYGKIPHSTLLGYILVQDIVSNDSELRSKLQRYALKNVLFVNTLHHDSVWRPNTVFWIWKLRIWLSFHWFIHVDVSFVWIATRHK